MAPCSRGITALFQPARPAICAQCRRAFVTSPVVYSGHNKWSKIKHAKGAEDAKKNKLRDQVAKKLTLLSKLYGPNPDNNPQLATTLAAAKKAGVPKNVLEQAVARGQGRSMSGASLETLTIEAMIPPSVALIMNVETDSKARALQDINQAVKRHKGRPTATEFLFSKMGRVVFEAKETVSPDGIMDDAIEAGAEDLEADEDGNIVIWSQPSETMRIVETVGKKFDLKLASSEIIWAPNEDTMARIDSADDLRVISDLVADLQEIPDVQSVYVNAKKGDVPDEEWAKLGELLDV